MEYISVVFFSIVQAITEFVPVSSSGHLVVLHAWLPALPVDAVSFDVFLHGGTLLATIVFFHSDLAQLIRAWVGSFSKGVHDIQARLAWLLLLATIPAALAGYFFENIIESALRSPTLVAAMLALVGVAFLVVEKTTAPRLNMESVRWPAALGIGCAQALALIPGTSRSGITIIAGMIAGLKREAALRFSFLLSVPIILGANVKKIAPLLAGTTFNREDFYLCALGFLISFVLGYFVIKYLLLFVRNNSLAVFAYYRFVLAAILLLI
jgi:undecaprenyl-diphosphatase